MEDGDVSGDGREILKEIREEIEMCGMLYPSMKKSGVFPEYALHMTEIGEQTGRLDETMEALAEEQFRIIELPVRPTAENLAKYFYEYMADKGYQVLRTTVYETQTNAATYAEA